MAKTITHERQNSQENRYLPKPCFKKRRHDDMTDSPMLTAYREMNEIDYAVSFPSAAAITV